jgi:hypothetical protein
MFSNQLSAFSDQLSAQNRNGKRADHQQRSEAAAPRMLVVLALS